jgi:hypothetical protein
LQGIKIHESEFLYGFALKRNKLPGYLPAPRFSAELKHKFFKTGIILIEKGMSRTFHILIQSGILSP